MGESSPNESKALTYERKDIPQHSRAVKTAARKEKGQTHMVPGL